MANAVSNPTAWALVSGGSKGIGKEIALELARRGYGLILVARSQPLLETLAADITARHRVPVKTYPADLTHPATPKAIADWCSAEGYPVSVLVNNAGMGVWDRFSDADVNSLFRMNALNVDAVVWMCHAFLPMLRAQPRAWILNVASTGAYQPIPFMALYGAGKAYVRSFSWALRHELRRTNVSVTCLSPGGVWTEFMRSAGNEAVAERNRMFMMRADKCARIAVKGLFRRKGEIIPGWYNGVAALATKFSPVSFATATAARLFKKETV